MNKKEKCIEIITLFISFILMILLIFYTPILYKYRNNGKLIINEIVASNKTLITDSMNNYNDFIELYNGYDYDINLYGYTLSDSDSNQKKWSFPDITIKAHDYLLVYANGNDSYINDEVSTNFKLSKKGEVLTLSNQKGDILSRIYYTSLENDMSYGFNGEEYVYYYYGTPKEENSGEYSVSPIVNDYQDIHITEYVSNNVSLYKSYDNNYYSVIEITNNMDHDINLLNYHLSDTINEISKWSFPNITVLSHDTLIIYLSGLDSNENEIHTNFKLSNSLIFSDDNLNIIDNIKIEKLSNDMSMGLYNGKWYMYESTSIGSINNSNYVKNNKHELIINEVSSVGTSFIELKNVSSNNINLSDYSISDKSSDKIKLPNVILKSGEYYLVYGSDKYSYSNGKLYTGFNIGNSNEIIYLYKNDVLEEEFLLSKLINGVSIGINNNGDKVLFNDITMGRDNSSKYFLGYASNPIFNINGGYVDSGTKIKLETLDNSTIYYTLDGSWPNKNSYKYTDEITINKTTIIKAISYRDDYLESEVVARTFFVGREHDLPIISITSDEYTLFNTYNGLLGSANISSNNKKKISFEFYEDNGLLGISFTGLARLTGMDSRQREQKSIAIYLKKNYGFNKINYPLFEDNDNLTYSSFTLRNSGEDPYSIRIQDTVLTHALKDEMDIDMQDYRAVVVYLNGKYYGLYNLREKLNGDYIENKYDISSGDYDLIKYTTATEGDTKDFNELVNYIKTHNVQDKEVYKYIESKLDIQEFINYMIVESYYGNTDQGNIRYWRSSNGKWRFMLYDLDWSLWNTSVSFNYPVMNTKSPSVTYVYSIYEIGRKLYTNSEFKELYLTSFSKYLKTTFKPDRMISIVDELSSEIRNEMPYHISRWPNSYYSMNSWENNLIKFKKKLENRYNYVINNFKSQFNLTQDEYDKYFKGA